MPKSFDSLITDISVLTNEIFDGQDFIYRPIEGIDDSSNAVVARSERSLRGYDAQLGTIEVFEEYLTRQEADGDHVPFHNLVVEWGNEAGSLSVDLAEGDLDDGAKYDNDKAIELAEFAMRALYLVKPFEKPLMADINLKPFETLLTTSSRFYETVEIEKLESLRFNVAFGDIKIKSMAERRSRDTEFADTKYQQKVEWLCARYDLNPAQVDALISMRLKRLASSRFSNASQTEGKGNV